LVVLALGIVGFVASSFILLTSLHRRGQFINSRFCYWWPPVWTDVPMELAQPVTVDSPPVIAVRYSSPNG
jgi:hypothetical protein